MLNRSPVTTTTPALTSIRVRASSTQTEFIRPVRIVQSHSGTQTEQEDNNNKVVVISGNGRALPRVIDAAPKPKLSKLVDLANQRGGSGSSWGDDEDRPSVERRSYTSRIPTPIKPTVIPVVSSPSSSTKLLSTPSKRELPDIPSSKSSATSPTVVLTPQLTKSRHHHHGFVSASKSDPAASKVLLPAEQLQLPTTSTTTTQHLTLPPPTGSSRPVKASFWGAWWRLWNLCFFSYLLLKKKERKKSLDIL